MRVFASLSSSSTNSESLSQTASRISILRNVMWLFSCETILLINSRSSSDKKFLSACVRECVSVCVCEREREKETVISVHKKGGKH